MNATTRSILQSSAPFWAAAGQDDAGFAALVLSDDPIAQAIGRVADELDALDDDIISRCRSLAERLNLAAIDARDGNHVDRNGVVQHSGLDVDRMCAERARCIDHLKILVYTWTQERTTARGANPRRKGGQADDDR